MKRGVLAFCLYVFISTGVVFAQSPPVEDRALINIDSPLEAVVSIIAVLALAACIFYAIYRGFKFGHGNATIQVGLDGKPAPKPLTLAEQIVQLNNMILSLTESNSTFHFMDKDNEDNEDHLKQKCRSRVNAMRNRIQHELSRVISDKLVVAVVCRTVRMVYQGAIIRNHFTKELMQNKVKAYRDRIYDEICQEFIGLHLMDDRIPDLDVVQGLFSEFTDVWILAMKEEVVICCEEKIEVYNQYLPRFDKIAYLRGIVQDCIKKNERYISELRSY